MPDLSQRFYKKKDTLFPRKLNYMKKYLLLIFFRNSLFIFQDLLHYFYLINTRTKKLIKQQFN